MFNIIFGIGLLVIGIIMPIKSNWFLKTFGRNNWAEQKLGSTITFYKILGILMIFFGLTMIFGLFGGIIKFVFGPLIPNN